LIKLESADEDDEEEDLLDEDEDEVLDVLDDTDDFDSERFGLEACESGIMLLDWRLLLFASL
jgi:hypothetical protein